MQLLTEYEWTFIRIATLMFLCLGGFLRYFYIGKAFNTYDILVSTALFILWLLLSKVITNYLEKENITSESISLIHVLFYYVAVPLIIVAIVMFTGFFKK